MHQVFVSKLYYSGLEGPFANIFLWTSRNVVNVVIADTESAIDSARKTPVVPRAVDESMNTRGIRSMIFLNTAKNRDILACPSPTNVFWAAHWRPNTEIPVM